MSKRKNTCKGLKEDKQRELTPKAGWLFFPLAIKPDHFSPLSTPVPIGTTSMESTASDKEGKTMKDSSSDVHQQEEEKAKEDSKEGNASSSTPLETATHQTEGSDKMTLKKPSGEGNVYLPFKKLTIHGDDDIISGSKSGDSSERASQKLQDTAAISDVFDKEIFFFEIQITPRDIEHGRLFIPAERAIQHFPPLATAKPNYEQQIEISDTEGDDWYMTLTYNRVERAFVITSGWQGFVDWHSLKATDVILFYRPFPRLHSNHFLIEYVRGEEAEFDNIEEFKQENFLFQLQLSPRDVGYGGLIIPKEEVNNHLPGINIPVGTHKLERLIFTDAQNIDWWMKIIFDIGFDAYLILEGWEGFVRSHKLEAMDVIRFYKPVRPSNERHFLIECVKREEAAAAAGTSQTQLGGAKKDGDGGDRKKGGGRRQGDRGSSGGKGKTICCWTWKNQRGGRERTVMMALEEYLQVTDSAWEEMIVIK